MKVSHSIKRASSALLTVLILLLIFISPLSAKSEKKRSVDLDEIVEQVEERYDKLKSVSAGFTQEVVSLGMATPMVTGGRVWFKKPGMMRWKYSTGSTDELIGNREKVWLLQPDLNQAIESDTSSVSPIVTDFLSGVGRLRDDFTIHLASKGKSSYRLSLVPKNEMAGVERLTLEVGTKDSLVYRTTIEDAFGTTTTVTFVNVELNVPKDDSFFNFVPPEGLNVIKQ